MKNMNFEMWTENNENDETVYCYRFSDGETEDSGFLDYEIEDHSVNTINWIMNRELDVFPTKDADYDFSDTADGGVVTVRWEIGVSEIPDLGFIEVFQDSSCEIYKNVESDDLESGFFNVDAWSERVRAYARKNGISLSTYEVEEPYDYPLGIVKVVFESV